MDEICLGFASNNLIGGWGTTGEQKNERISHEFVIVEEVIDSWGFIILFSSFMYVWIFL